MIEATITRQQFRDLIEAGISYRHTSYTHQKRDLTETEIAALRSLVETASRVSVGMFVSVDGCGCPLKQAIGRVSDHAGRIPWAFTHGFDRAADHLTGGAPILVIE